MDASFLSDEVDVEVLEEEDEDEVDEDEDASAAFSEGFADVPDSLLEESFPSLPSDFRA